MFSVTPGIDRIIENSLAQAAMKERSSERSRSKDKPSESSNSATGRFATKDPKANLVLNEYQDASLYKLGWETAHRADSTLPRQLEAAAGRQRYSSSRQHNCHQVNDVIKARLPTTKRLQVVFFTPSAIGTLKRNKVATLSYTLN